MRFLPYALISCTAVVAAQSTPSPVVTAAIGTGCNGAGLAVVDAPLPGAHHLRFIGSNGFFAPIGITVVVLGLGSTQPIPIPNWPGCEILTPIDCSFVIASDPHGVTEFPMRVDAWFSGLLYAQMLPFDSFGQLRATPIVEVIF